MGDSLSWAAEQEEAGRRNSPEYKENAARCKVWNSLINEIKDKRIIWTFTELIFLLRHQGFKYPEHDQCNVEDLKFLISSVASSREKL